MNFSYFGGMASNSSEPEYKVAPAPKKSESPVLSYKYRKFSLADKATKVSLEYYNPETCDYGGDLLDEEEVRRLHSFLSQWLEKNQEDYF